MRIALALFGVLLVAGCAVPGPASQADDPIAVSSEPVAAPSPVATPSGDLVTTLAGEWRVAGIDGADFNEEYGLALSADDREIWWHPRCAGMIVPYRIDGLRFFRNDPPALAVDAASSPPVACMIGLPARLADAMRAINAADRIERTASNGILLSGGGRSLLLFSQ